MSVFRWPGPRAEAVSRSSVMFPNRSRSLDAAQARVSFWGYASTVEVTFQVDSHLLQRMAGTRLEGEASLLQAFDTCRDAIEEAAAAAYDRQRVSFCRLEARDFPRDPSGRPLQP